MDKVEQARLATVAALMRELKHSQEWSCFADALNGMISAGTESVLQSPIQEFEFRKGRVHGLREALALPDILINRSKHA